MLLLLLFFCTPSIIAESRAPCLDKLFKIRDWSCSIWIYVVEYEWFTVRLNIVATFFHAYKKTDIFAEGYI